MACETAAMDDAAARTLGRVAANNIELAYETFGDASTSSRDRGYDPAGRRRQLALAEGSDHRGHGRLQYVTAHSVPLTRQLSPWVTSVTLGISASAHNEDLVTQLTVAPCRFGHSEL